MDEELNRLVRERIGELVISNAALEIENRRLRAQMQPPEDPRRELRIMPGGRVEPSPGDAA